MIQEAVLASGSGEGAEVLDIGCGPGAQTLVLADALSSGGKPAPRITAVDLHAPYLQRLEAGARERGFENRIKTVACRMEELPFEHGSFDLIWSEGAVYIIGFEEGLTLWSRFLKPRGYLAVSEISWLRPVYDIPDAPRSFWSKAYPSMATVPENIRRAEKAGFSLIGAYTLPESDWLDSYYVPLEKRLGELQERHADDRDMREVIEGELEEIELYRHYGSYYGYVFYVFRLNLQ
jgi:ubiquinone/menaquinone biosynthesis C-methylase UbiE